jgi:hypothetical protein
MQKTTLTIGLCIVISLAGASESQAQVQKWTDNGFLNINGAAQMGSHDFTETSAPTVYGESASISTPHQIGGGPLFDVSGGVRVAGNLGVGIGYSWFSTSESPTVTAQIPNPVFFNKPRSATAPAGTLEHSESVVHLQVLWMLPVAQKLDVAFFVGPSFFSVSQDLISEDLTAGITEGAAPFTTVTLGSVPTATKTKSGTGYNVGADISYMIVRQMGIGVLLRYSAATVDLPTAGGGQVSVDAGGFQIGVGARVRF